MGPWPFDRLIEAVRPLCESHEVVVQSGTSTVELPCEVVDYLSYHDCLKRMEAADVVISHAGNSVRLLQRMGKLPIIVAREAGRGEMRNDHQVRYARDEGLSGRAITLEGDAAALSASLVDAVESRRWAEPAPALSSATGASAGELLERLPELASGNNVVDQGVHGPPDLPQSREGVRGTAANPFARHPTARYRWAFEQLRGRVGAHLDLGIGDATFLRALVDHTALDVTAADPHSGYLDAARQLLPETPLVQVAGDRLPFDDASFDSLTLLDVLEHTPDDRTTLDEVSRVLRPGGLLVMSVPARYVFTPLDPDNAKFRFPRLHRAVYSARFGADVYRERFEDSSDGLRGDMSWTRPEHTNYDPRYLIRLLLECGLVPQTRDGANLFWRFFQVPALLLPARAASALDGPLRWDARTFSRANLFLTAIRGEPSHSR
jgi:SAM-dependent methyltransferase/UDP-N-acetylglucosamine transferase subunit ALG13